MNASEILRGARRAAGISQRRLAELAATSPAAVAAYETGAKSPTVATLSRLLAAMGVDLVTVPLDRSVIDRDRRGEELVEVLDLADAFPAKHRRELRYPPFGR